MPNGTSTAVTEAGRLPEIGFPEFTAKLITDTFDALVAANLRQMEAYSELLAATAKTLQEYVADHKQEVSGQEIWDYLTKYLPGPSAALTTAPGPEHATLVVRDGPLTDVEAGKINTLTGVTVSPPTLIAAEYDAVIDKIAEFIAGNRYNLLKDMVRMGILRLVIDSGVIETRLTFTTYGRSEMLASARTYDRDTFKLSASAKTGSLLSPVVKAKVSTSYSTFSVRTTSAIDRDVSGSTVQIYGSVIVRFKSDYQPLS